MSLSNDMKSLNYVDPLMDTAPVVERTPVDEKTFRWMMAIERKRTERSKSPFLLMLLEAVTEKGANNYGATLHRVTAALLSSSRDTDLIGWYKENLIVGALFTGLVVNNKRAILDTFLTKVSSTLRDELSEEQFNQVRISVHLFPDDWDHGQPGRPSNSALYPDLLSRDRSRRTPLLIKRVIDVLGSATMLVLFAPLLAAIALAIKLSSKGPVFYRQLRVGRYGQTFAFLKFRSMYADSDCTVHQEFVTQLIASRPVPKAETESEKSVYKITNDKRITRLGKLLRRSSLDELPQLFNVLKGDMSLVGTAPSDSI